MQHLPDELRLVIAIAVNAFVFVAAFRFSRRIASQDRIGAALDALLILYLVQYLSVCVPGLLGILRAETMLLSATALGTLMLVIDRRAGFSPHVVESTETSCATQRVPRPARRSEMLVFSACLLFVLGYFCGAIYTQSSGPLVGDDALTYHLPAAGQWMQTGRIGLYNTWFFNPANTYSPLAGSTFLVWLIAPIGADQLAQFVQMPALILIFLAIIQIARSLGVRLSVASLAATGALLSRPFVSEAILIKDDHFIAAFFLAIVAGLMQERLNDRLGPWRIGIGLGLFFATKYTALLTAPLLLLAIDAPFRALHAPGSERRLRFERERDRPDRTRLAVDPHRVLAFALEKAVAEVEGDEPGTCAPAPERPSPGGLAREQAVRVVEAGECAVHGEMDVSRAHLAFRRNQHGLLREIEASGSAGGSDGRDRRRRPVRLEEQVHVRMRPGRLDGHAASRPLHPRANSRAEQPRRHPARGFFSHLRADRRQHRIVVDEHSPRTAVEDGADAGRQVSAVDDRQRQHHLRRGEKDVLPSLLDQAALEQSRDVLQRSEAGIRHRAGVEPEPGRSIFTGEALGRCRQRRRQSVRFGHERSVGPPRRSGKRPLRPDAR